MTKRALITGITGQDGAYLSKFLIDKGYEVYGGFRRSSANEWRLNELGVLSEVNLVSLELLEFSNVQRVIDKVQPDEIYNLAAQSFVSSSFEQPIYTNDVNALGAVRLLEAIRMVGLPCKFYQASTSELFGKAAHTPQNENTPFYPRSPYGIAKLSAHWSTVNYRESYGMFTCSGILFNHESSLRGPEFVTRKITKGLAAVSQGLQDRVELGNLDAKRDWGHASDFVRGMWLMLQQPAGEEFVLGTGKTRTIREFLETAATALDITIDWSGSGSKEVGRDAKTGKVIISINPEFYRPAEVEVLLADPTKAEKVLGWTREFDFRAMVEQMVEADLHRLKK